MDNILAMQMFQRNENLDEKKVIELVTIIETIEAKGKPV